jgi:hypothetical protein
LGRPDDGPDPTSFFNAEFLVTLKPFKEWRADVPTKKALVDQIEQRLTGVLYRLLHRYRRPSPSTGATASLVAANRSHDPNG